MILLPPILNKLHQELAANQTKESAWNIINEYFNCFDLENVHEELWLLTASTIANVELEHSQKALDRQNLIFFFEYTKMFFEAIYLLHNKYKESNR